MRIEKCLVLFKCIVIAAVDALCWKCTNGCSIAVRYKIKEKYTAL